MKTKRTLIRLKELLYELEKVNSYPPEMDNQLKNHISDYKLKVISKVPQSDERD